MKLKVLGSSSKGNCYLFIGETETLIIDAGINLKKVKEALNFDLSNVSGLLLDHSHGDHSKFVESFMNAGIDCYSSKECFNELDITHHRAHEIKEQVLYKVGGFKVIPFPLQHEVKNYGFLVSHPECGNFCFVTDTHFCRYRFKNLNNILIEANHDINIIDERLMEGKGNPALMNRIITSHMEINTTREFLASNDLSKVNSIVLIHLSDSNSDAERFQREIKDQTGKNVHVAEAWMEIEFNAKPF